MLATPSDHDVEHASVAVHDLTEAFSSQPQQPPSELLVGIGSASQQCTDQPPSHADQPPSDTDQPPSHTDQPPSHTDQPPSYTDQPLSHTDQPTRAADEPPCQIHVSSSDTGQRTENAVQPDAAKNIQADDRQGDRDSVEDACTQPIIHPAPRDLASLAALLAGPLAGPPPVVDLQGRTLAGECDDDITVSHPGLKLMNGMLQLPAKVSVLLTGDGIHLQDVTITQPADEGGYSLDIQAKGVKIKLCRLARVFVQSNSSVSLLWCILSGSGGNGVVVTGPDSLVDVRECDAHTNQGAGFIVSGAGSVMWLEGRCRADNNSKAGFLAQKGARMICSNGCMATGNQAGFLASCEGSQMVIGHICRAEASSAAGFQAQNGAKLAVGERCEAYGNGQRGFCCVDTGSKLCLGKGCRAVRNGGIGVLVQEGAKGTTGQDCIAASNANHGFFASGQGAFLRIGAGTKAAFNAHNGFSARAGGQVHAGAGCEVTSIHGAPPVAVSGRLENDRWHE